MTPANIIAMGTVFPQPNPTPFSLPDGTGPASVLSFQVADSPGRGLIAPARLRRLGRVQRMALTAAHRAMSRVSLAGIDADGVAVSIGTGMGELDQTVAFLENMIALDEREPRPAKFVNSVHNSLAAQVAIEFGLTGENHTFTHGAISFETALRQAIRCIGTARADMTLVCGADALNAYAVAAGVGLGIWRDGQGDPAIHDRRRSRSRGSVPGEGAAAFLLVRDGPDVTAMGRVRAVACLPFDPLRFDAVAEAAFIRGELVREGLSLSDFQVLLLGANGDIRLDRRYMGVADALRREHPGLSSGTYKTRCGEFCTASALGLALALQAVHEGHLPEGIALLGKRPFTAEISGVLLYHLSLTGYHTLCAVSR